ncbi:MAG: alginate export family protein [Acidobacteriia bacterium]|nr:alginate export family protein [Terriglobia bacterium]
MQRALSAALQRSPAPSLQESCHAKLERMFERSIWRGVLLLAGAAVLSAQCIVNNPGGSKVNPNRPSDSDTRQATVSPLSALNARLPRWICFTAGYRTRFEAYRGGSFQPEVSDSYLLTRFRFGMYLKPVSWLHVFTETQDTDAFGKTPPLAPPYQETWDLRRAYVDIGDIQESHFGLRAGRQDLNFGDGLLIGTSYWRNASRGYDAVQLVTNWGWAHTALFAASPVNIFDNGLSHHQPGNNLYGLDAKMERLVRRSVLEPFVFWRVAPRLATEEGVPGNLSETTVGIRSAGTIYGNWDYDTEGAHQFGNVGRDHLRANAWMGIAGYTFPNFHFKTRLFQEFDYASGDRNPHDGVHGTFDQLFPNIHDHLGLADQFARQNLKALRSGARVWLRPNWIVAAAWNDYWLASATDAYYNSSGGVVARDARGLSGTHIAEEYDLQSSYRFDRNLEFGVGLARALAGEFLVKTGHRAAYTYPYLMMSYNFF